VIRVDCASLEAELNWEKAQLVKDLQTKLSADRASLEADQTGTPTISSMG
jgi:hypothetical protein